MMKSSLLRSFAMFALLPVAALVSGCAADGHGTLDEDEDEDEVATEASELGSFEYNEAVWGGDPPYMQPRVATSWGLGGYYPGTDNLYVKDLAGDGFSVGVQWRSGSRYGVCRHKLGSSDRLAICYKNMPEGQNIEIRLARCDGGRHSCRSEGHWFGFTGWSLGRT
jgi:hypothetical protein